MFINKLWCSQGVPSRGCTCLKCTSLSKDTLMRVFFFVGALETSAPPEIRTCLKCTPYKAP